MIRLSNRKYCVLKKTNMMHRANISTNVLARLGKGAPVSMESMEKICKV